MRHFQTQKLSALSFTIVIYRLEICMPYFGHVCPLNVDFEYEFIDFSVDIFQNFSVAANATAPPKEATA